MHTPAYLHVSRHRVFYLRWPLPKALHPQDYQKWGPLIGLYTGARLNEISQIHLSDIRQEQGIWCLDLNDEGEGKHLKSDAARRLVPSLVQATGCQGSSELRTIRLPATLHLDELRNGRPAFPSEEDADSFLLRFQAQP